MPSMHHTNVEEWDEIKRVYKGPTEENKRSASHARADLAKIHKELAPLMGQTAFRERFVQYKKG